MQHRVALLILSVALATALAPPTTAQNASALKSAGTLEGMWRVDLRPTPDAEPYYQLFDVTAVEGDSLRGTFYGSPIETSCLNTDWDGVYFAFVTYDGSGPYHHAGRLVNGRMEGTTFSPGRGFLLPWRAEKVED